MVQEPASRSDKLMHTEQLQAESEYWLWMARSSALGAGEVSSHRRDSNAAEGRYTPAAATHGIAQEKKESHLRFCGIGDFSGSRPSSHKRASDVVWRLDR